jgi:hypothetical protein
MDSGEVRETNPNHRRVEGITPSAPGFAAVHWCAEKVTRVHSSPLCLQETVNLGEGS